MDPDNSKISRLLKKLKRERVAQSKVRIEGRIIVNVYINTCSIDITPSIMNSYNIFFSCTIYEIIEGQGSVQGDV